MLAALWFAALLGAAAPETSSVEIGLELRKQGRWEAVDPATVFQANDEIRFRFRTFSPGYLYVLNRSASGETAWLHPRLEQGHTSRVEPGPVYLVPGEKGSFVVGGTPGFDITYWIVSPTPIESRPPELPAPGGQPSTLLPRCREQTLKSRGICVDERAGPRPLSKADPAPPELPALKARDLTFRPESGQTRITAKGSATGVIVYEFRIAHR
jgi:hypothetical protein